MKIALAIICLVLAIYMYFFPELLPIMEYFEGMETTIGPATFDIDLIFKISGVLFLMVSLLLWGKIWRDYKDSSQGAPDNKPQKSDTDPY